MFPEESNNVLAWIALTEDKGEKAKWWFANSQSLKITHTYIHTKKVFCMRLAEYNYWVTQFGA